LLAHQANVQLGAQDDFNALHFAAQKGHTEMCRILVNAGEPCVSASHVLHSLAHCAFALH